MKTSSIKFRNQNETKTYQTNKYLRTLELYINDENSMIIPAISMLFNI